MAATANPVGNIEEDERFVIVRQAESQSVIALAVHVYTESYIENNIKARSTYSLQTEAVYLKMLADNGNQVVIMGRN